jgi:hypothetical protein
MKKRIGASRTLRCEYLEARELMAGDVTACVDHGILKVIGDNQSNAVEIRPGSLPGSFIVDGTKQYTGADTRINGSYKVFQFSGVTNGVQVIMNGGNDHVQVGKAPATTRANIPGPFGLGVDMGSGNDVLYVRNVKVAGSCGISGQNGNDTVYVYDSIFAQDLIVDTANGDDDVSVIGSTASRYLHVGTGAGNDRVRLDKAGAAWIYGNLGSGNDSLVVTKCQSALQPGFDGGSGQDSRNIKNDNIFPVLPNCINFERWS